ncbi:MAG: dihydrodipicolinate synthase/N-acetylneuraminate lyase [Bacteroidetes bacterium]|nr:dihydrodipicolinate synthase/N-acetylneuraminate lyase [Bacteroidota bacterium]
MSELQLTGIIPPMITPFKQNGDVDEDAFIRNIDRWNNDQLSGYLVLGSNSEAAFLSWEEKLKLIELTVKNARKGRIILAGTGLESARETIRFTNTAAKLGAQAALVLTPFYYIDQMGDEALIAYFKEVADHSDIPILIYNVPKFTHVNVSVNVVKTLSAHPNILGMKDSTGNIEQLTTFKKAVGDPFNMIVGTASALYPALKLGVQCGILALSNCLPNQCAKIQSLFGSEDMNDAEELHQRIVPVNAAVAVTHGVPGLKYASTLLGYEGGFVRNPLRPLDDSQKADVRKVLTDSGFLDAGNEPL